jgi:hypothetical protein
MNLLPEAIFPKEVEFTKQDLMLLRDEASKYWQNTDAKLQLPGAGVAMTESELIALSWLSAAINLLMRKPISSLYITPKLVEASSEPSP